MRAEESDSCKFLFYTEWLVVAPSKDTAMIPRMEHYENLAVVQINVSCIILRF